jgi:hypothetical protein
MSNFSIMTMEEMEEMEEVLPELYRYIDGIVGLYYDCYSAGVDYH